MRNYCQREREDMGEKNQAREIQCPCPLTMVTTHLCLTGSKSKMKKSPEN